MAFGRPESGFVCFPCNIVSGISTDNAVHPKKTCAWLLFSLALGYWDMGCSFTGSGKWSTQLSFFRGLPVSLATRFAHYACFYFLVFIPDAIMLASLSPDHLYYSEAFFLIFFGYSLLLLLNSLQLYDYKGIKDYLKVVVQLFLVIIVAIIPKRVHELSMLFFLLSVIIFCRRYYRFEPKQINVL